MADTNPMSHLAALELVSTALDRERVLSKDWREEAAALRRELAEHQRWEDGLRKIGVMLGIGTREGWEISDVVERVRSLLPPNP